MNPQRTVVLLDELETLGFTNEAFWRLHHFREKDKRDTIHSHKSYCERIGSFKDGDDNERVQVRLEKVLNISSYTMMDTLTCLPGWLMLHTAWCPL
jgi:hypothetical protein